MPALPCVIITLMTRRLEILARMLCKPRTWLDADPPTWEWPKS